MHLSYVRQKSEKKCTFKMLLYITALTNNVLIVCTISLNKCTQGSMSADEQPSQ